MMDTTQECPVFDIVEDQGAGMLVASGSYGGLGIVTEAPTYDDLRRRIAMLLHEAEAPLPQQFCMRIPLMHEDDGSLPFD